MSKVASEINVGFITVVEFLTKKGFKVDKNPNAKLTVEMYELLLKEYHAEKQAKETSKKLDIGISRHETVTLENTKEKERDQEFDAGAEYIIKNTSVYNKEKSAEKPAAKPDETKAPVAEVTPPVAEVKSPVVETREHPVEEKPVEKDEKPAPEPEKQHVTELGPVVIGKIDLDSLGGKKKKKALAKDKSEEQAPAEISEAPATKEEETPASLPAGENEELPVEENQEVSIPEMAKEAEVVKPVQEEKVQDANFIATEYTKITGPKIVGKINIPEPPKRQPVASSGDNNIGNKKKRKRIKNTKPDGVPGANTQGSNDSDRGGSRGRGGKRNVKPLHPEVSDEEIQKQIRETLARLSAPTKSKAAKYRRQKRDLFQEKLEEEQIKIEEDKKNIKVTEFVTASELARMMDVPVNEIISTCMSLGLFVSINQRLDAEVITIVAEEFGYKVEFVNAAAEETFEDEADRPEDLADRHPIVTVMGHVDHGKTSLLDYIRRSNVIAGEAGGITQHIGAYEVTLENGKKITFLDTPGHEAFTAMRARGAKVTDVAIIVVAADDSVMPQTVEAINHAQAARVPIVFAINKIDKAGANPEKIKEELAKMNLLVEDWGGKYQSQEISAKKGINVEKLLDKVLLEAEMLDLKCNPKKMALGTVLESSLEKGRGNVAKLLVQNGTMKIGDMVLAGCSFGRVKAMYNERNVAITTAGPASPVLMLGLNGAPGAGDSFYVMSDEREAKNIANKRMQLQREQSIRTHKHITLDEIGRRIAIGDFKELNVIIKGDVDGSVEALSDELYKLSTPEVQVNVIHKSVGQITESDVLLASASNAIIIGFQVRPSVSARKLAEHEQIDMRLYSVIYNAINELKSAIEGMLSPEIEEKIICNLEVREIFKISKVGTVAGCMVLDGKINRNTKVRIIRNGIVVYSGNLGSLKRFKDDVKEAVIGQDCGLNIENFNDIKVGDIIEGYEQTEVKRKL